MKEEKKRLRGNKSFTRVNFSKKEGRKGEKKAENLFPIFKKGEQNEGKWSGSGHFLGF